MLGAFALCKPFARGARGSVQLPEPCPLLRLALPSTSGGDLDADLVPGVLQVGLLPRSDLGAVHHRLVGEVLEGRVGADAVFTAVGRVPDGERALESVAVHGDREQGERLVHDSAVDVDATVVVPALVDPVHVVRLGVLAELFVVVGGARSDHAAERLALDVRHEQPGADEPVRLARLDVADELVDQHAADVGEALVERTALALVFQAGGVVRHTVEHLMADDAADDELGEDDLVTVAVHHLALVEVRVVVAAVVVDAADQVHAEVVERIALAHFLQEAANVAVELVGVIDERERCVLGVALVARLRAGEAGAFLAVEDAAVALAGLEDGEAERVRDGAGAGERELLGALQGGEEGQVGRVQARPTGEQEAGNDTVEVAGHGHGKYLSCDVWLGGLPLGLTRATSRPPLWRP